jgi:hypothetical protein
VKIAPLPSSAECRADYGFDAPAHPYVRLRADWREWDVAHELVHAGMQLAEGYRVLAWRRPDDHPADVARALGRIRSYVDDEVVHGALREMGWRVDGEIIDRALFEHYENVSALLETGRPRGADGMAHLDAWGRGALCRAAYLLQAELILSRYGVDLAPERRAVARRFVERLRTHRRQEAAYADEILALFRRHDVRGVAGHAAILDGWSRLEGIHAYAGLTHYVSRVDGFILPAAFEN